MKLLWRIVFILVANFCIHVLRKLNIFILNLCIICLKEKELIKVFFEVFIEILKEAIIKVFQLVVE